MAKKSIDIRITPDWIELQSNHGRAYQRLSSPAGILRISLQPPPWDGTPRKDTMERELRRLVSSLGMSFNEPESSACDDFLMGPAGISVYRMPQGGFVTFCLIAAEIALFCSFEQTGGTLQEYEDQMTEALAILQRSEITA